MTNQTKPQWKWKIEYVDAYDRIQFSFSTRSNINDAIADLRKNPMYRRWTSFKKYY